VVNQILGYKRHAGPPGIRNHVVCLHTVECSSFVSQRIATIDPQVQSLGFPGCYRNRYASRLMIALATHPNVGACLLVSLGCEVDLSRFSVFRRPEERNRASLKAGRLLDACWDKSKRRRASPFQSQT